MKPNNPLAQLEASTGLPQGSVQGALDNMEIPSEVSATVTPENEEGTGILDYLVDIPKGVVRGAGQAVNATLDLGASALDFGQEVLTEGWDKASFDEVESSIRISEDYLPDVKTVAGELAESISQFAVEFMGVGKVAPFLKVGKGAGFLAKHGKNAVRGSIADFAGFKATEENLSAAIIEQFPQIESEFLEWMANDGKNPHIEGRFKNTLEGLGLGIATDSLFESFRVLRAVKKADSPEQARKAAEKLINTDFKAMETQTGTETIIKKSDIEIIDGEEVTTVKEAMEQGKEVPKRIFETKEAVDKELDSLARGDIEWGEMDSERVLQLQKAIEENPEKFVDRLLEDKGFGRYFTETDEGHKFLVGITKALGDKLDRAKPMSFDQMSKEALDYAKEHGMEKSYPLQLLEATYKATESMAEARQVDMLMRFEIGARADKVYDLARKINSGIDVSPQTKYQFAVLHEQLETMWRANKNYGTATARNLAGRKVMLNPGMEVKAGAEGVEPTTLRDIFKREMTIQDEEVAKYLEAHNITDESINDVAKNILKCNGNPDRMFGVLKALNAGTWTRQFNFWFTQNILTGPVTHMFNVAGNVMKTGFIAGDRLVGALVRAPFRGSLDEVRDSIRYAAGIGMYITDALRDSLKAMKTSTTGIRTQFNNNASKFGTEGVEEEALPTSYQSVKNLFLKDNPEGSLTPTQEVCAKMLHVAGYLARGNARLMSAEDEFFRQLNFRAAQREAILRRMDALGISKRKNRQEWEETYKKFEEQYFTSTGLVNTKNADAAEALRLADSAVFAQEIQTKWVKNLQVLTNQSMIAKAVLPFIKTVWNVTLDSIEHTPGINYFSKELRDSIAQGGAKGQEALGKIITGAIITGLVFEYVGQGMIIGELSSNKKEREMQERMGMKPYSIRIGDNWYQYQRLDPLGAMLGICSNMHYLMSNNRHMAEDEKVDAFFKIAGSLTTTIAEKSFLVGLNDLMDMLFAGDKTPQMMAKWSGNFINSLMPGSGLLRQAYNEYDRDVQMSPKTFLGTVSEGPIAKPIKRMLNSFGVQVREAPVKYDWLTGETPQRAFIGAVSEANTDWVLAEMEELARSLKSAPMPVIGKVKLTQEQFSRYCELHGTLKINGKTLMEALEDTMKSYSYDYDRERYADEAPEQETTRRGTILNRVIKRYRERAEKLLLEEDTDLAQAVREKEITKKQDRAGQRLATVLY